MIVAIEALRLGVGLAADDASEDASLIQLEAQAAAWIQEKLERSFEAPAARTEYKMGNGTRLLPLLGNVESLAADAVVVRERSATGAWTTYETPTDIFEVRRGRRVVQLARVDGWIWSPNLEYEITYADGYTAAPADIQALVIDAVNQSRNALIAAADEGTVKSETIGDYSYTLDLSVSAAALAEGFNTFSSDTLNRWRRVHV